jgi:signal peptidase I
MTTLSMFWQKWQIKIKNEVAEFFTYNSLIYLLQIISVLIVFETFVIEPFRIPSGSMMPTLLVGDHIFVNKFAYGYSKYSLPSLLPYVDRVIPDGLGRAFFNAPKRGDIVVFRGTKPHTKSTAYIKRIIGLPGDNVQILNGNLYINGRRVIDIANKDGDAFHKVQERVLKRYTEKLSDSKSYYIYKDPSSKSNDPANTTKVFNVPPDHYFCLGDNRNGSADSRFNEMGFIPVENLVGKASIIYWNTLNVWESIKTFSLQRLFTVL